MKRLVCFIVLFVAAAVVPAAAAAPNACQLLTAADVAAVQGQTFVDAKLTASQSGELSISQCFFQLPSFVRSVSVELIRGETDAFWRELEPEGEEREEGEEVEAARREVDGIGEDALWSGTKIGGALYVRVHGAVLRISVGGPWSEEEKLLRAKRLAEKALARL